MIKIEINGQIVNASEGDMLIDVADGAKISIPRFCYHKKLSIAANCRMCLVEVEGAPKAVPACATPVADGMKVNTKSPKAVAAQKAVMEFLLINHPLDCPICDQGGECELQDVAMDYGDDVSQYSEGKRIVGDRNVGSLIQTDMTRCIHCTRCVRFGQEIAGLKELGATGRSEWMEIGTYIEKSISSELSGNMIDLCPVGALTSKPYRYKARSWEMKATPSIAPHDSIGSNILVHTRNGEVMRVVPQENEAINETWISDRDRFSYEAIAHQDRMLQPTTKEQGEWQALEWEAALEKAVTTLSKYKNQSKDVVVLISPSATLEEMYLARKLFTGLGMNQIEYRLNQQDFRADKAGLNQGLNRSFASIEQLDAALLVGCYLRKELPLLNNRLRKAQLAGAKVSCLATTKLDQNMVVSADMVDPSLFNGLAGLVKAACERKNQAVPAEIGDVPVTDDMHKAVEQLDAAQDGMIMLGQMAQSDKDYALLLKLASMLTDLTGTALADLAMFANTQGAHRLLGDLQPHQATTLTDRFANKKLLVTLGVEPEADAIDPNAAMALVKQVEDWIHISPFSSETSQHHASLQLPMAVFAENAGSYINLQGDQQSFKIVANATAESKPLWKILRVLGNVCQLDGFDYVSSQEVLDELSTKMPEPSSVDSSQIDLTKPEPTMNLTPAYMGCYAIDSMVRRAPALQATPDAQAPVRTI
ncbi:NADH-quinone oxidoreductase subunit NuoG [Thiomicrospira sp. ALE5]|uniref:NADH-quinone oxidoreductase subunit NuoG n=1 Tax=Thiomicrospira sp. ALE5 TaxID=748650 RepID=UPI0008F2D060|nr:NADH-quinone oxidoreductase subunit NuoG [Thiomicrospira sp. ALE5]SFR48873.1 NADH-quinone oxidoreductase subunit G [Thiomicrospira sp. ALE5]